ncbi:hypothetical protein BCR39DRAFT_561613 [Naematelia encephala]|uniref:Heme-degrading domain-containing protein n=1 Tax=Naematelia encephala TaxID=71784 RepID=A0A1Y2APG6_9TREE|nr:hypothetical protein BCR39DRAFT_561613 [Naematelia encephala]
MSTTNHPLASLGKVTDFTIEQNDQIASLVAEQESLARLSAFNYETAWTIGNTIRSLFLERYDPKKNGVSVKIETSTGHVLFSASVGDAPGVMLGNWSWVEGKAKVVRRMGKSSLRVGRELASKGREPESQGLYWPEFVCHGGAFPIFVKGVDVGPIGAIMVSGLAQLEDHQLIVDALVKSSHLLA